MIKVKETLHVSAESFFYQLTKSAAFDVRMATGKKVTEKQLYEGYRYKKTMKNKMGRSGEVRVRITELKPPVRYSAEFKSAAGTNEISYDIEKLGEDKISVTYTEGFAGDTKSQDINYKIIGALYKRRAKKKTARKLHDIEAYIQKG